MALKYVSRYMIASTLAHVHTISKQRVLELDLNEAQFGPHIRQLIASGHS